MKTNRFALYELALTHRSWGQENQAPDNERLEFLGDAVLQLAVSDLLFLHFPNASEGDLSQYRKQLVNNSHLADLGRRMRLGEIIRLGRGEAASGGRDRTGLLAGAFEALLGAIYLDHGFGVVSDVVEAVFTPFDPTLRAQQAPKTKLNEWLQANQKMTPTYRTVKEVGPDHAKQFHVEVIVNGDCLGAGAGSSKKAASIQAARDALQKMAIE